MRSQSPALLVTKLVMGLGLLFGGLALLPESASASVVTTITLQGTPVTSAIGNSYAVVYDSPTGTAPLGSVTVVDSVAGSCTSSSYQSGVSDGSGGLDFAFLCTITSPESGGETVRASYSGLDFAPPPSNTLTVGTAPASLSQSGSPVTSESGNTIIETLDAYTNVTPTGTVTATDSASVTCESSSWTDEGPDGAGGELYQADCTFIDAQGGGDEINAVYSGTDYSGDPAVPIFVAAAPATLFLNGTERVGSTNLEFVTLISPTNWTPQGAVTVTDANSNTCTTSSWTVEGPDGGGDILFLAICEITQNEDAGTTSTATYAGNDYTTPASNTISVQYPASLTISSGPATSASGNSYGVTLDTPIDVAPNGYVTVFDTNDNECQTSSWTDAGSDGIGGELFTASCGILAVESGGEIATAEYTGTDDYYARAATLDIASVPASISITGSPVTSASGNNYSVQLDASTTVAPHGYALVSDSASNTCHASDWSDAGSDGAGGELFDASCSITAPESGGMTTSATYVGGDYAALPSSSLTVDAVAATLHLSGSPVAGVDNVYDMTLDASTNVPPVGSVTVTDSSSNTCTTHAWSAAGSDGAGGEVFSATCTITASESAGATVTATYAGADYTASESNALTVVAFSPSAIATITAATITGTPFVGDVLSAVASGVTGIPSPTPSYQWKADGVNILGATGATYTLVAADAGDVITVSITEINGVGPPAMALSPATSAVTQDGPSTAPPPSGTAAVFGTGISCTVALSGPTVLTVIDGTATVVITIPAGALPPGTTVTFYPILNIAALTPKSRTLILPFGLSWQDGAGASPVANPAITINVADSTIGAGDTVDVLTPTGSTLDAATVGVGTASFGVTSDPVFLITAPMNTPAATHVSMSVGFRPTSAVLTASDRSALAALARRLTKGQSVSITGFAKGDLALAALRAHAVANFLDSRVKIVVHLHFSKNSANKVTFIS